MDYDVTKRQNIKPGMLVEIVKIVDRDEQILTRGFVKEIISHAVTKRGVLVLLTTGEEGNVKRVITQEEIKAENFKFWNVFLFEPALYSIWDSANRKYVVIDHANNNTGALERTALLFDSLETAHLFVKGTKYQEKNYKITQLNRKKHIQENFKTLKVDYFRVNITKKISFERLNELEAFFNNM